MSLRPLASATAPLPDFHGVTLKSTMKEKEVQVTGSPAPPGSGQRGELLQAHVAVTGLRTILSGQTGLEPRLGVLPQEPRQP